MMKASFVALLFSILALTSSVFAQDQPAAGLGAPGCGDPKTKFAVKAGEAQHPAQAEAGKALVYFIEDDSNFGSRPKPTTRMGVDGAWIGATHGNSYFSLSVNPGVHHLCASWQTTVVLGRSHSTVAAHFTAEAGSVYYFVVKNVWTLNGLSDMNFGALDSDEGQLLVNKFSFSTFHQKN